MTNDELAFRNELVSLLPRLRRFSLALAGRRDAAEDLLQSAIERALRRRESYDRSRRLDSWMFKIMQNLWFDMRRQAASAAFVSDEGLEVAGEDGRDLIESRDELRRAREAFGALPEDQRAVVALVVLEGFSYAAAAEALDVPIGTVMSRLSRARSSMVARAKGSRMIAPVRKQTEC
jgi:RNA polymerase sigma-70 factor (ECF subfamily)